ncbi:TRIM3 [Branchiostoma lanceolatum]|uniref:TRIM3 protein n=1 Tax=Branchiostoma lanceolatum TaxID=7740 RepID=A0A8J9Z9K8_BRALA|nr:TRIM3 [Branchiostoma lanceolatum]
MATAPSTLGTRIREELSCSICLELFTRPKVLPCQHTFCQDCLQDHAGRGGTFQCPICRWQVRLPPQGVAGLPDNHLVTSLCERLQNQATLSGETREQPQSGNGCSFHPSEEVKLYCDADVPIEVMLRTPEMAKLYAEACRQGSLPVHSTRIPVVGQYRSGKSCFIKRLMGETVIEEEVEPITDGINIISDVQSKTWKKSGEEIDEIAGPLLRTETLTEDGFKHDTAPAQQETMQTLQGRKKGHVEQTQPDVPTKEHQKQNQPDVRSKEHTNIEGMMSKGKPEKHKTVVIPDNMLEAAERMLKAGITKSELGTATHPRLSFWDFGGQATYYGTHHCFITYRGVYILVMSLLQKLSDPVADLDYKASVDNLRTGGDYLDHWLNTVHSHTQQHQTREPGGKLRPPVILVLTRKDKEYIEEYKEEIRRHIKGKAVERLVMPEIFAVDNTTEDAEVDRIRDYIRQVARDLPHMGEEIPISWLHLKSKLRKKREGEDPFCKLQAIAELARHPDINITDKNELAIVLTFLHDRGDVIFFNEPSLRDDVTLKPQVMVDAFKTIITVPEYQQGRQTKAGTEKMWETLEHRGASLLTKNRKKYPQTGLDLSKMWERLEREGVLSDELLTKIWEKKDQELEKPFLLRHKSFLKALMEKYYLLCNATHVGDASDEAQQEEIYFVPALLSCERDNTKLYPANMNSYPQALYFVFSEKFLPSGMFCRLQALCVRRFGLQEACVFAGCARFPTDDKEQAFVVTKVNHYVKVELLSSSNVFTEGLRVRRFISSALFEIKEKWIPCIQYELCCSTQEVAGELDFRPLSTDVGSAEQDSGIPSAFRSIWMTGNSQIHHTENSGGDIHGILPPTENPSTIVGMRTIGPVLDTMEQGGGLTLDQCDHIRSQQTPIQRVHELVSGGQVDPCLLGAAVEMCSPEFEDLFWRYKRGKDLVLLRTEDDTDEFAPPLQTTASETGVWYSTHTIAPSHTITVKTVDFLLNTNNGLVLLVISPQSLHHKYWSNLDYEFPVRNEKLLLPILLYPPGSRDRMVRVLQQRAPVLCSLEREEMRMEGSSVTQQMMQQVVQNVVFGNIFSRLDETDVRLLLRVWFARTGDDEGPRIGTPRDLMMATVKSWYITTGGLGMLEMDMIAAGISFPAVVRDISGIPDKLQYPRTAGATVGPLGGVVKIPGFVKLVAPPGALQRETAVTLSTVDVPGILRSHEEVNWISGYPWSLGEDACPRELLEQVLFSPAIYINLHGAQLNKPVELQTWRPPGSEGMECILLKHHNGEGWTDITASTLHHVDADNISVCLTAFCTLCFAWTPADKVKEVERAIVKALLSRTLDCRFAGYIKPHEDGVEFHVVCRDHTVETDDYSPDFSKCGGNDAEFDLYDGDKIEVAVSAEESQGQSRQMLLRADHCRRSTGQNVQMRLQRSNGKHVNGDVIVTKFQEQVCHFSFWEEGDIPSSRNKRGYAAGGSDSGLSTPTELKEMVVAKSTTSRQSDDSAGPSGIKMYSGTKDSDVEGQEPTVASGFRRKPVVLMLNDEYGTANGGISTIHRGMGCLLVSKGAKVYSTVLQATQKDKEDAAADGVQLIFPETEEEDTDPNLTWLTRQHRTYYPHLPSTVDFIVGHVNITSRAARRIKEDRLSRADLVQVTHVIPEDVARYKSEEKELSIEEEKAGILEDLQYADVIFSVGPHLYDYYKNETREEERHYEFLPEPSDIFKYTQVKYVDTETKVVLTVGRASGVEMLKGYDLAANAMGIVIDHLPHAKWRGRGVSAENFSASKAIIEANVKKGKFKFTPLKYGTQEDLSKDMQQAHVVLMPSRAEPFGLVGLEAIAAGVPVLVSDKSGLAKFLKRQDPEFDRTIVEIEDDDDEAAKTLAKRIIKILKDGSREFQAAQSLKKKLLASNYWAASHRKFLDIFGL